MDQHTQSEESNAGLTREQLSILQEKLWALREQLIARLSSEQSVLRDDERMPIEPMEAAVRTGGQDDAGIALARDRRLLAEIERALAKIDEGRYGLSESSGEPIGFGRLNAVPWARQTTDEEEEEERG
jgi:DnaK suppressor protein